MNEKKTFVSQLQLYHVMQPIVDIVNDEVVGYELLLRSKKYPNPKLLFGEATKHGQSYCLDMASIEKAFSLINKYCEKLRYVDIFINVLPTTVNHPEYFSHLRTLTSTLKLKTSNIVFEITEDEKKTSLNKVQDYVLKLKRQGFRVAIDDFGQGDSTIQYVQKLNPHVVKLDRYYTKGLAHSYQRKILIENMLFLLNKEMKFIIEGIETKEDLQTAKSLGVRYVQGFYLGKPERIEHYISKSR